MEGKRILGIFVVMAMVSIAMGGVDGSRAPASSFTTCNFFKVSS